MNENYQWYYSTPCHYDEKDNFLLLSFGLGTILKGFFFDFTRNEKKKHFKVILLQC